MQSYGIGRAAMDLIESIAINEPFCARTLVLDTIPKDDQANEDIAKAFFGGKTQVCIFHRGLRVSTNRATKR